MTDAPLRSGRIKQRIVEAARTAFNEERYGHVSTTMLAERLGISQGNLWYHFKKKSDLLEAIQAEFIKTWEQAVANRPQQKDPIEAYIRFLLDWKLLLEQYIFMFRDRSEYGQHAPQLVIMLPQIYGEVQQSLTQIYRAMVDANLLTATAEEIDDLAFNTILVSRFFFECIEEWAPQGSDLSESLLQGLLQHLTLFAGRMDAQVLQQIRDALKDPITAV